jgi:hypothetical protein
MYPHDSMYPQSDPRAQSKHALQSGRQAQFVAIVDVCLDRDVGHSRTGPICLALRIIACVSRCIVEYVCYLVAGY